MLNSEKIPFSTVQSLSGISQVFPRVWGSFPTSHRESPPGWPVMLGSLCGNGRESVACKVAWMCHSKTCL